MQAWWKLWPLVERKHPVLKLQADLAQKIEEVFPLCYLKNLFIFLLILTVKLISL